MIGSFSHHKLGNLKIKSALVFAIPLFYLCYWSEKNYKRYFLTLFLLIALTLQRIY
jgi:hypothetical protein